MLLAALPGDQSLVHDAVLYRVFGTHEKVTLRVPGDGIDRLAGVLGKDLVEPPAQVEDLLRVDLDVGGLALEAAHGLVDHDARVGQCKTLASVPRRKEQRAHARRLADAKGRYVGLDELHGVVDGEARRHRPARRVDVEEDVLVGILRLEKEELRHDQVGGHLGDRPDQEHHALLQQARVDVVSALAAPRLLDHHRDQAEIPNLTSTFFPVHEPAAPISSSNATSFSVTFAFDKTHLTTLASSAMASISESRSRCM